MSIVIQISGQDPLRDEQFAYADKLREGGYVVQMSCPAIYTFLLSPFCSF